MTEQGTTPYSEPELTVLLDSSATFCMPGMTFVLCLYTMDTTVVSDRCRRGFPSSCFQLLQADHLHESLEDILAGEHGIARFDPHHLENPNTLVFLRRAADLSLARFLQILVLNPPFPPASGASAHRF